LFNISQLQIELLQDTESTLSCSGVCFPPLFYFQRDINIGKPYHACYGDILSLSKNILLMYGILALIHFSLLFISKQFFDKVYEKKV
jgi:hypothetical protein